MTSATRSSYRWRLSVTGSGAGYLVICALVFLLGVNYSNNLIFTLCFMLSGFLAVSLWFGVRNLTAFTGEAQVLRPVHAGQWLTYVVNLQELGGRGHFALRGLNKQQLADIQPEVSGQRWRVKLLTEQRGTLPEQGLRVESSWPLGLLKISRPLCLLPEAVVYPAADDLRSLKERKKGSNAHLHEEAESLSGLREYQAGDNLKRVDWRAMARRDQLYVKQFDGAAGDPLVWLDWDDTTGLGYEERISCLCHWILDCHQRGQEYGLKLPGQEIAPSRDQSHLENCLTRLALLPKVEPIESAVEPAR